MSEEVGPRGTPSSDMTSIGERDFGSPLAHFPASPRIKDRLPACMERIRMQKYLKEKLLPPH